VLTVQQGASGALALLSLVVALAFALFVARWGRVWAGVGIVLLAAAAGLAWSPLTRPAQSAPQASGGIIPSEAWSAERLAALRAQNRPVFVNFTAAWCVNCKANEAGSLSSPRVAAAFRAGNVVYLKADWTTRDAAIAAELARHGRAGIPLYLYYAPGAQTPRILPPWLTENLLLQTVAPSS
jgi:thiol:disulfide interchange protein DsbD